MSKATVTYHAPKGDERVVDMGGLSFFDGQPLEIEHTGETAGLIGKLRTNQHFEVSGGEPAEEVVNDAPKAVHKGRGVYSIVHGVETLVEGLNKTDADAFNAMSEPAKSDYISGILADAPPPAAA